MAIAWKVVVLSAYSVIIVVFLHHQNRRILSPMDRDLNYILRPSENVRRLQRAHLAKKLNVTKQLYTYDKPSRLPGDLKFILKWNKHYEIYAHVQSEGQWIFIENNCPYINCYMTHDRSLLVDHRYFDAIVFEAEKHFDMPPYFRSAHQKYIFSSSNADSHRLYCHPIYDTFYNLTWTYKLDSDIRWSHITIEDKNGTIVGPRVGMQWLDPMLPTPQKVINRLAGKRKAAAWFASTCNAPSGRERVAQAITEELQKYNLKVDTYGWCGTFTCPKERMNECLEVLEQHYYFYFSFESALVVDYVTEQLLHPLQHMAVPVVFGGADYSRFLPPGSYIDARKLNASAVAVLMNEAIQNQEEYRKYFRWHNHYAYKQTVSRDVCKLCEILNDPSKAHSVVKNFRSWWHDDDDEICKEQRELYKKHQHLNLLHQL